MSEEKNSLPEGAVMADIRNIPDDLQFYTYAEVAEILRVKRGTVRTWVALGKIRTSLGGKGTQSLVSVSEVRRFVNEREKSYHQKVREKEFRQMRASDPSPAREIEAVPVDNNSADQNNF